MEELTFVATDVCGPRWAWPEHDPEPDEDPEEEAEAPRPWLALPVELAVAAIVSGRPVEVDGEAYLGPRPLGGWRIIRQDEDRELEVLAAKEGEVYYTRLGDAKSYKEAIRLVRDYLMAELDAAPEAP